VFGARLRRRPRGARLPQLSTRASPRDPSPNARRERRDALGAERGENLAVLSGMTPADLDRSGRHPEYGMSHWASC